MKILTSLIVLVILTSCAQFPHMIEGDKEYVRLSQLNLTSKEKFKLSWMTDYESEWAKIDSRFGGFVYDVNYDYKKLIYGQEPIE